MGNILPREDAVVPYNPQQKEETDNTANFDLMELLSETMQDVNDEELVLAATQCEASLASKTPTTTQNVIAQNTAVMKKVTPMSTFTNCSFGSIGTLNIHVHKI